MRGCYVALSLLAAPIGSIGAQDAVPPLKATTRLVPRPPAFRPACDSVGAAVPDYRMVAQSKSVAEPPRIRRVGRFVVPQRLSGLPARVELQFVIDTTGQVAPCSMTVLRATDPRFVPAAVQTVESMEFLPAHDAGQLISAWTVQPIIWQAP